MEQNILKWLEDTSAKYPDKCAIRDEKGSMSFSQLISSAKSIGTAIGQLTNGCRKPIAVFLPKGEQAIASFIGITFSGNIYVPIDVEMPILRVKKIFETLNPCMIITTSKEHCKLKELSLYYDVVTYEELVEVKKNEILLNEQASHIIDTDVLYIIFTSGSTGTPKGVAITHRGVINYITWAQNLFHFSENDIIGNQSPFYFDNSVLDIYTMVKTGATLNLIPHNLFAQPVRLLEYIKENNISTIFWVPSALIMVSKLKAFKKVDVTGNLKRVLFAGEVMPAKQLNVWKKYLPKALYANLYGPTEITVDCTFYIVERELQDDEPIPIGKAIDNTEILVLDENNELVCKSGQIGELCVRGAGLAVGYYNNPEKTLAAFVQNPLNTAVPEIIYRTGDLVKYNEYGELVYLSRKDFQIKHQGYRIELGEIETAVSSLEEVTLCCCLYDEKRQKIVLFIDVDLDKNYIKGQIENLVPEYMIPRTVVYIENMPINSNGKIDRVRLKELL